MKQCYLNRLSSSYALSSSSFLHEVFYGFNWKYFTLINPEVTPSLNFILWTSHYHTMRRELLYFLRFIADRLQTPLNNIGVTAASNILTVYIPGVSQDIRLLIVYRELMTTPVGTDAMYRDGDFYDLIIENPRGPVTFTKRVDEELIAMVYDETPEMFFNRTGIPVVTPTVLLTEIFQDWELIIETSDSNSWSNIEDKFKRFINVRNSNSNSMTLKAMIASLTSNHVIDINPITEDNIRETIIRVVYSQRTITFY
jgi:hypothetical protein